MNEPQRWLKPDARISALCKSYELPFAGNIQALYYIHKKTPGCLPARAGASGVLSEFACDTREFVH
jgi:hypothetical protein